MTEDEAKRKWCPFARAASESYPGSSINRSTVPGNADHLPPKALCVASACMAWRWSTLPDPATPAHTKLGINGEGYCGLAGKP